METHISTTSSARNIFTVPLQQRHLWQSQSDWSISQVIMKLSQHPARSNEFIYELHYGSSNGWWLSPTPLKNDGVKVSWDDDIPNMMGKS